MFHNAVERLLTAILVKINFFIFQRIKIVLHTDVIIRESSLVHALCQVMFLAKVGERFRCVQAALIAMKNQTFVDCCVICQAFGLPNHSSYADSSGL